MVHSVTHYWDLPIPVVKTPDLRLSIISLVLGSAMNLPCVCVCVCMCVCVCAHVGIVFVKIPGARASLNTKILTSSYAMCFNDFIFQV